MPLSIILLEVDSHTHFFLHPRLGVLTESHRYAYHPHDSYNSLPLPLLIPYRRRKYPMYKETRELRPR